jgi:hypothetical protein
MTDQAYTGGRRDNPLFPRVRGYCPNGCGETLFLGAGGHVTCSLVGSDRSGDRGCPDPALLDKILSDPETEHTIQVGRTTFTLQHPLRERGRADTLHECELHQWVANQSKPPVDPGTYRVRGSTAAGWTFEPAAEPVAPFMEAHGNRRLRV